MTIKIIFDIMQMNPNDIWKGGVDMRRADTVDTQGMREYIANSGIKQNWLAAACGMTENQLTLSLNDKRAFKADEYLRICLMLGVSLKTFVTVKEVPA